MTINLDFEWLNLSQLMANLLKHRAKTQPDGEHQRLTLPYIVLYSNSIRCLWLFVREQSNVIIALESHPKKQIRSIIIYENCFDSPIHFFSRAFLLRIYTFCSARRRTRRSHSRSHQKRKSSVQVHVLIGWQAFSRNPKPCEDPK